MTTVERTDRVKAERIHPYIYAPEGLHEKQKLYKQAIIDVLPGVQYREMMESGIGEKIGRLECQDFGIRQTR
jgi:hypothetical protein